ncbi:hypothetical protein [Sulfurimonas sp.]
MLDDLKLEYNLPMNLDELKNKTLLFLGKSRAFSQEEFNAQMQHHNIRCVKELETDVSVIVEGRMMTPIEQNLSDTLYEEQKYTFVSIDALEKALAKTIDDNTLLMSLKLSNNTERLKSFLQNGCISDSLFFKILKMYKWQGEDFFENDDNRDVTAALIGRFYENIERNHNVQYATTGLIHLVRQTKNSELLEHISLLEPLKLHPKIKKELASNDATPQKVLLGFLRNEESEALEAMAYNKNLEKTLLKELAKDEYYAKIIAQNRVLDEELFILFEKYQEHLAKNSSLNFAMQKQLLDSKNNIVLQALASNTALYPEIIQALLSLNEPQIGLAIYANPATDSELLSEAYKDEKYHISLAQNSATPTKILEALYAGGKSEILDKIARNESTPVEILYQLQLESKFERAVKTNKAFGKHIQSENIGWLV